MKRLKVKQFSQNVDIYIYINNNYPVEEIKITRLKTLDNPFE